MSSVNDLLKLIECGESHAAEALLPIVYAELKQLASMRLAREYGSEQSGATSLVHEAYVRLVGGDQQMAFANQHHFFSVAAEAMRRILIDRARKRNTEKHGGKKRRLDLDLLAIGDPFAESADLELLALSEAIEELAVHDAKSAELVKLRFFCGCKHQEAAEILGISRREADSRWTIARTWLFKRLSQVE